MAGKQPLTYQVLAVSDNGEEGNCWCVWKHQLLYSELQVCLSSRCPGACLAGQLGADERCAQFCFKVGTSVGGWFVLLVPTRVVQLLELETRCGLGLRVWRQLG